MALGARISGARLAALAIGFVIGAPIVVVLTRVGADSGGLWEHLASTVLPRYLHNTLWLVVGVSVLSVLLGVSSAWLVTVCRFPGRSFFRWALLLPLAGDYWFPAVRSLPGAIAVLALCLYPYVYLASRAAFTEQSVCLLEAGRTLGLDRWRSFFRLGLPLARPSIAAGTALVLMETLAEFGAVHYFAVDTFATGIYRAFTLPNDFALVAAAQLSTCLLVLALVLLAFEAYARRAARYHPMSSRYRTVTSWRLEGGWAAAASAVCALPVTFGFALPFFLFVWKSRVAGDARAREVFIEYGTNSFVLAAAASGIAVLLALAMTLCRRIERSRVVDACARWAGTGYAIPGGVIAIGILVVVAWVDRRLAAIRRLLFGGSGGLLLSGSPAAMLYGYQTRFLAVALQLLRAGMSRIRPSFEDAGRTLGATPWQLLRRLHFPLLRTTLLAAVILVFVDVIKELPATLILRPFGYETLAVRVYQLASDERLSEASTGALAMVVLGMLPVAFLSRTMDRAGAGRAGS